MSTGASRIWNTPASATTLTLIAGLAFNANAQGDERASQPTVERAPKIAVSPMPATRFSRRATDWPIAAESFTNSIGPNANATGLTANTLAATVQPVNALSANALRVNARTELLMQPTAQKSAPWFAPLASLAIPGSGQALMRQQRAVAYVAAEAFLVLRAVRAHRDENSAKLQYQRLAAEVARSAFGADRPTGPWDYYEILESYLSSGEFDFNTGGKFTPETNLETYNGIVWLGARRLFWDDPNVAPPESSLEYQRAIDRYKTLAMQGSFRFSWKDQGNVRNEYILSIADANRSQQRVISTFGLLAATHLASAVDAYINVRLRRYGGAGLLGSTTIRTDVRQTGPQSDRGYGAAMTLSIPANIGSRTR